MKLAYLILAHKLPEQLTRLVNTLNNETSHFFIHIDKRAEAVYSEAQRQLAAFPNVQFVSKRYSCRWGQFSIVNATIASLEMLVKSGADFEAVFLLSGQDYPIKHQSYIDSFLAHHPGQQFIDWFPLDQPNKWTNQGGPYQAMRRVENWHFAFRSKWIHLPLQRKLPNGFLPYGGSQWWTLTRDCVEWIVDFVTNNPEFLHFFRYTFIPDELFFQTLLLNSPFRKEVVNDGLRYVDFSRANPTPPAVLLKQDFEFLRNGTDALFARKFDMNRDSEILDLIDREILNSPDWQTHPSIRT